MNDLCLLRGEAGFSPSFLECFFGSSFSFPIWGVSNGYLENCGHPRRKREEKKEQKRGGPWFKNWAHNPLSSIVGEKLFSPLDQV
jgi:hypothetical protein